MNIDKKEKCENCLHYRACLLNSYHLPSPCSMFEDKAGYRKASEVAREIFEEIEELLEELKDDYRADDEIRKACGVRYAMIKVAELKKKYTEEAGDGT